MTNEIFIDKAKKEVIRYYKDISFANLTMNDVFVVWSCKTLQNFKAILATNAHDLRVFEVTYNGDKHECYLDAYIKEENRIAWRDDE